MARGGEDRSAWIGTPSLARGGPAGSTTSHARSNQRSRNNCEHSPTTGSLYPTRNPRYSPQMAHYLFNFSDGDRQQATVLLQAKMWGVGRYERHRDALAPGDLALIYLPTPEAEFIGRVECATAVHDWTPSEAEAYPGDSPSGVLLSHVEEWDPAVPMDTVVERIDPTASNPLVQANAAAGFRMGVVRITGDEYEAALALSREARGT
jgi:hypothetical protein